MVAPGGFGESAHASQTGYIDAATAGATIEPGDFVHRARGSDDVIDDQNMRQHHCRLRECKRTAQIALTLPGSQFPLARSRTQALAVLCCQWQIALCRQHPGDQQTLIEAALPQASDMEGDGHHDRPFTRVLPACPQTISQQHGQAAAQREVALKLESCNQFAHGKFIPEAGDAEVKPRWREQAGLAVVLPRAVFRQFAGATPARMHGARQACLAGRAQAAVKGAIRAAESAFETLHFDYNITIS
jgi:hypothetical protein